MLHLSMYPTQSHPEVLGDVIWCKKQAQGHPTFSSNSNSSPAIHPDPPWAWDRPHFLPFPPPTTSLQVSSRCCGTTSISHIFPGSLPHRSSRQPTPTLSPFPSSTQEKSKEQAKAKQKSTYQSNQGHAYLPHSSPAPKSHHFACPITDYGFWISFSDTKANGTIQDLHS